MLPARSSCSSCICDTSHSPVTILVISLSASIQLHLSFPLQVYKYHLLSRHPSSKHFCMFSFLCIYLSWTPLCWRSASPSARFSYLNPIDRLQNRSAPGRKQGCGTPVCLVRHSNQRLARREDHSRSAMDDLQCETHRRTIARARWNSSLAPTLPSMSPIVYIYANPSSF